MTTITETNQARSVETQRIVLRGIKWETYEALAEQLGDQHIRMAYDRGVLELMSPGPLHERSKKLIDHLFVNVLHGLRLPFEMVGETRWKREATERGLEPDECYYLSPEKLAIVQGRSPDRRDDPYPDLAVEIDIENSSINKLAIYADLGVPEVWRYEGETCSIHRLRPDGTYEVRNESLFLPLHPEDVVRWIEQATGGPMVEWLDQVQAWVRDDLARRPRPQGG